MSEKTEITFMQTRLIRLASEGLKMLLAQGLAPHLHACILRAKEI